mgnify:CR=1 FL=1
MLFFVDWAGQEERMRIHKFNLLGGEHKIQYYKGKELKEFIDVLLLTIMKERPDQIIFDRTGCGQPLFDSFVSCVNSRKSVKMLSNGMLYYETE